MAIQRCKRRTSWDGLNHFMDEDENGEYVLYADHAAEVERLRAELDATNRKLARLQAPVSEKEKQRHSFLKSPMYPLWHNVDELIAARAALEQK